MGFLHIQNTIRRIIYWKTIIGLTIYELRKIYSYMDKICWSDRKTDKVQANIDI